MSLKSWKIEKLTQYNIKYFYYLCPIDNIENVLKYGILSKNLTDELLGETKSFADNNVQEIRDKKNIICSDQNYYNLHDLVPLYFTPKTPTLYKKKDEQNNLMILVIDSEIICDQNIVYAFSDGNAASHNTRFYWSLNNISKLPWNIINAESWCEYEDGKRKRCCEFLIYPNVSVNRIKKIIISNNFSFNKISEILKKFNLYKRIYIHIDKKGEFFFKYF